MQSNLEWITIYKRGKRQNSVQIYSRSPFFRIGEQYKIRDDGERLTIERVGIHYEGKSWKCSKNPKDEYARFSFLSEIGEGKFYFDQDESTADKVVIYYK